MVEIRARLNGEKTKNGYLVFADDAILFHEDFRLGRNVPMEISSKEIYSVNVYDSSERDNAKTLNRAIWLGWMWALVFPAIDAKTTIEVETVSGDILFFETGDSVNTVRQKINPILTRWFD